MAAADLHTFTSGNRPRRAGNWSIRDVSMNVDDFPGGDAVQIGFHHHREQRLINSPATLQQRREGHSRPQFRDLEIEITGHGGQHPASHFVAVDAALLGPFEQAGTDERGRLPLDPLLVERLSRDPSPVGDIGEFQLAKKVEQGRLGKKHRMLCSCREIFDRFSLTITRWLFTSTIRRSEPGKPNHSRGRNPGAQLDPPANHNGAGRRLYTGRRHGRGAVTVR